MPLKSKTLRLIIGLALLTGAFRTDAASATEPAPMTPEQLAHETVRVAVVQMNGHWIWRAQGESPETLEEVLAYIDRAGKDKADMVVFPELLLGEVRVPSPFTDRIADAARRNNINVLVGCFEIIDDKGNFGNSTLIFDRQGEVVGRFFKMHPAIGEPPGLWPPLPGDAEYLMQPGEEAPVFDLDFGRIGILTCYDGYFPELFRILALKGAEIIVWPNARGGSIEQDIVTANVKQNYVHMVTSNKAVGSGSMIAAWPGGQILAIADEPKEEYILAELPMTAMRYARKHAREFYQRRPDLYREIVQEYNIHDAYQNLPPAENWAEYPVTLTPEANTPRVQAKTYWMDAPLTIEIPASLHAGDRDLLADLKQQPQWEEDTPTGQIRYSSKSADGIEIGAYLSPARQYVKLELTIRNNGQTPLQNVRFQPCLILKDIPQFQNVTQNLMTFSSGQLVSLDAAQPDTLTGNLLVVSANNDKNHLAFGWENGEPAPSSRPDCLTGNPQSLDSLPPGAEHIWFGKIYFTDNNTAQLLADFERDQRKWSYERQLRAAEAARERIQSAWQKQ